MKVLLNSFHLNDHALGFKSVSDSLYPFCPLGLWLKSFKSILLFLVLQSSAVRMAVDLGVMSKMA